MKYKLLSIFLFLLLGSSFSQSLPFTTYVNKGDRILKIPIRYDKEIIWHTYKDDTQVTVIVENLNVIYVKHRHSTLKFRRMYNSIYYVAKGFHVGDSPNVITWFYNEDLNYIAIDYIHYSKGGKTHISKREILKDIDKNILYNIKFYIE